jgi:hypothetical protein
MKEPTIEGLTPLVETSLRILREEINSEEVQEDGFLRKAQLETDHENALNPLSGKGGQPEAVAKVVGRITIGTWMDAASNFSQEVDRVEEMAQGGTRIYSR